MNYLRKCYVLDTEHQVMIEDGWIRSETMADEIIHSLIQEDVKSLRAAIESLQETTKSLRELLELDRKKIERLTAELARANDPMQRR